MELLTQAQSRLNSLSIYDIDVMTNSFRYKYILSFPDSGVQEVSWMSYNEQNGMMKGNILNFPDFSYRP